MEEVVGQDSSQTLPGIEHTARLYVDSVMSGIDCSRWNWDAQTWRDVFSYIRMHGDVAREMYPYAVLVYAKLVSLALFHLMSNPDERTRYVELAVRVSSDLKEMEMMRRGMNCEAFDEGELTYVDSALEILAKMLKKLQVLINYGPA